MNSSSRPGLGPSAVFTRRLRRNGNSLSVSMPPALLTGCGFRIDDKVVVTAMNRGILITKNLDRVSLSKEELVQDLLEGLTSLKKKDAKAFESLLELIKAVTR